VGREWHGPIGPTKGSYNKNIQWHKPHGLFTRHTNCEWILLARIAILGRPDANSGYGQDILIYLKKIKNIFFKKIIKISINFNQIIFG